MQRFQPVSARSHMAIQIMHADIDTDMGPDAASITYAM